MSRGITALLLGFALLLAGPATAAGWTGNINAFLGAKGLDDDDWLADSHSEAGLLFDIGGEDWPVLLAADVLGSYGEFDGLVYSYSTDSVDYYEEEVRTRELNLGVRKYWGVNGRMHPYLGGGLAFVRLKAKGRLDGGPTLSDSGSGEGLWLGGGIQWRFNSFNLGFSVRSSWAEVELDSGDYQGGGGHAGVVLGYHW